jgi:hypothetical protein
MIAVGIAACAAVAIIGVAALFIWDRAIVRRGEIKELEIMLVKGMALMEEKATVAAGARDELNELKEQTGELGRRVYKLELARKGSL